MKKIWIATRAKKMMEADLKRYPDVETGGLLLGYSATDNAYIQVLEATDGGYQHTVHEKNAFEYDQAYEVHISNVLASLYDPPLDIVGVWHKHNHSCITHFSDSDEKIHEQLIQEAPYPCLSVLYEKSSEINTCCKRYQVYVCLLTKNGQEDVSRIVEWE